MPCARNVDNLIGCHTAKLSIALFSVPRSMFPYFLKSVHPLSLKERQRNQFRSKYVVIHILSDILVCKLFPDCSCCYPILPKRIALLCNFLDLDRGWNLQTYIYIYIYIKVTLFLEARAQLALSQPSQRMRKEPLKVGAPQ